MRDLVPIQIPRYWNDILDLYFSHKHMKRSRGGQGKGDIIAQALCEYQPMIDYIKEHNYQKPECEEKNND